MIDQLGAGKTLIAVYFMKHRLNEIRRYCEAGHSKKLVIFVAPTKVLVEQQRRYIASNCDASVKGLTGESMSKEGRLVESWGVQEWNTVLLRCDILVSTPEIIRQILQLRFIQVTLIDSVVLDECHHASGKITKSYFAFPTKQT